MKYIEIVEEVIKENNGLATISDFLDSGLTHKTVSRMFKDGQLIRIRRGYYALPNNYLADEVVIGKLIPEAVVSLESALFFYGYTDYTPRAWSITVPRSTLRRKLEIDHINIKPYFVDEKFYEIGKAEHLLNGVLLRIYDRERTICDCFKYRNKIEAETFNKALKAYSEDSNKNLYNLIQYAKIMRVHNKVIEYMGVLISD